RDTRPADPRRPLAVRPAASRQHFPVAAATVPGSSLAGRRPQNCSAVRRSATTSPVAAAATIRSRPLRLPPESHLLENRLRADRASAGGRPAALRQRPATAARAGLVIPF